MGILWTFLMCFQSSRFLRISAVSSFPHSYEREREMQKKNAYKITLTEPQREMRKNCEPLNSERHGQCTLSFF